LIIMEKGLTEALNVLEAWATDFFAIFLDTILLPFRFIGGLLE